MLKRNNSSILQETYLQKIIDKSCSDIWLGVKIHNRRQPDPGMLHPIRVGAPNVPW